MHRVDAVIQVFAELSVPDHAGDVFVGGTDQAYVDRNGLYVADPCDRTVLKHTQQLGLQMWRNVAYLIEEQSASVRLLELSDMVRMRICECSFDMAEQLAFEKGFGRCWYVLRSRRLSNSI